MRTTLEAMIVPVGEKPYPKTLEADENGSFLRALQECVGGRLSPGRRIRSKDAPRT